MKFVSYTSPSTNQPVTGVLQDHEIVGDPSSTASLLDLVRRDEDLVESGQRILARATERVPLSEVRLNAPIVNPPSFRDCMAFEGHAVNCNAKLGKELSPLWYEQPVFYFSNPLAFLGPNDDVPMAPTSKLFDFELEIAAVIGKGGSDLHPDDAESHIAGYMVISDWSARDVQVAEMPMLLGPVKGKDTATSLGPYLVTPDELTDQRSELGYDLATRATVNGEIVGEGNWADIYWTFGDIIAYASRGTRVVPGDVIGGGTITTSCLFEHLGLDETSTRWLKPGDVVKLEVESLGTIESRIVAGNDIVPIQPRRRR